MPNERNNEAQLLAENTRLRQRIGELEREREQIGDRNETILRTCSDGFWLIDRDGHILEVNDAYCRMSGYRRDELLTMSVQDVEAVETAQEIIDHIREVMARGAHRFESRQRRKDGTMMDLDITAHRLKSDSGKIFTFFRDITVQRQAERALRDSEARYRTLVEQLPAITYTAALDEASTTLYISPQIQDLIGFTPEEYKADPDLWRERLHPDDRERVLKAVIQSHAERKPLAEEYRMVGKDGRIVWFRDEGVIVKDENDRPLFLQGVMYDITERKKAEQALRASEERLRLFMDSATEGLTLWDSEFDLVRASKTVLAMFPPGTKEEDLIGKNALEIVPNLRQSGRYAQYLEVMRTGNPLFFDDLVPHPRFGDICINVKAFRVGDGLGIITTDVTHRRKAEEALRVSEEKYRTLVESAGEAIFTVDENGVFLFANIRAAGGFGRQPEELVGRTMWDVFPKGIADRQAMGVREVIRTSQSRNVTSLVELQGQPRWYNTTIVPLRDSRGKVTAAMGVARDVHELRQAEEQVRILSSAVEQSIDGVAMGDVESRLMYVNDAFAHMHGYTPQEMVGLKAANLYAEDQMDRYEALFAQIRKEGSYAGEVWHVRKDRTIFPCYVSVTLVKNQAGEVTGTVAVCRDMAEFKRKEEELTRFRSQMARAEQLASLGTLSATVAHQITQPLTVIRLSLDNVLDELMGTSCSSTAIRRLQDSIGQVCNITAIVNRFRHFARQSSDTRFGEVSVNEVAERVVRLLEESARQAKVVLRLKTVGTLPPVSMNETDLEQLFFALIENAIQASDGTKAREVVISGAPRDKRIELRFCDDCGGIAPENLQRLFEPFFTTRPRGQGTGLGLCIVHDVVSRAGGRVRVESQFGKGSTFFVTLPVSEGKTT